MEIIKIKNRYESKVYIIPEEKLITKIDCLCGDFVNRRLIRVGEFADAKVYAEPCKHLKPIVDKLIKIGYKMKTPVEMVGSDKLTNELWQKLLARANNMCECGCEGTERLCCHRRTRGSNGGKYNLDNCQVLTIGCHLMRHSMEFK